MTSRSFTSVLAALALLPRLYVAIAWTREPVWDGHYYHLGARGIAEGIGYAARRASRGATTRSAIPVYWALATVCLAPT